MSEQKKAPPPLFPHQVEGVAYLTGAGDKALFDEPGLGKTRQLIEAVCRDIDTGLVRGALVICPNLLKSTWQGEIKKYAPGHRVATFGNDQAARKQTYARLQASFYIINYEAVSLEKANLMRLLKFRPLALVLDESQRIKNPDALVTKTIMELRDVAAKRIIATGTPVANQPGDLWSQLLFLNEAVEASQSVEQLKLTVNGTDRDSGLKMMQELLSATGLRRRKDEVLTLPAKHFQTDFVTLSGQQAAMYDTMRQELALWVQTMDGETVLQQAESILTRLLRLAQLASNPRMIDAAYEETPAKFAVLDTLVEQFLSSRPEQKIIIWSSFVANIVELSSRYAQFGVVAVHGAVPHQEREAGIERFHSDPNTRIFIATPAAAREGLTLTEANVAIYVDRSFSLLDYLQSQDRIHRISQTRECHIINLLAQGTVDEFIQYTLETKEQVAGFIHGDRSSLDLPTNAEEVRAEILRALL